MHAMIRSIGLALVGLVSMLPLSAHAGEAGTAGFLSLRLGAGARAAGMGDAQVSIAQDATAAYWNPAGLASVERTQFTLMHLEWLSSVRMETGSVAHATSIGTFGIHFSGLYLDEIDRFEIASAEPTGSFNVYEIAATLAYGHKIRSWDVGLGVKGLHSGLDDVTASGWAVDAGARYHTRIPGLTFAGVVQNIGPEIKFVQESFLLPATFRAGADYAREVPSLRGRMVGAFDLVWPTDGDAREHVGLEFEYRSFAAARLGYKANYDSQGLTFGVGLRRSGYHFDYAYGDIKNDLGSGHKFAFSVDL